MEQIKHIKLEKLKPPEFDDRITPSPQEDNELMESIRELGVLLPLIVIETTDGFEIVAGNRRFAQAGRAGLSAVPCIIVKTTGAAKEKIKMHENLQRLPLSHLDQGYTFAHLVKEYKMTEQQISVMSGRSIAYISQHLTLIQSDPIIIDAVADGRINFSVARELIRCKDSDERNRLQGFIEKSGASQTTVRSWVDESNRESDNTEQQVKELNPSPTFESQQIPLYPCCACEVATSITELRTVKLCPGCHNLIFSDIEREKQRLRMESTS